MSAAAEYRFCGQRTYRFFELPVRPACAFRRRL